ncbi:restriction endonuclease [Haloarculaceae archaeon H-GB11]|nr:restriction endonuclease [Haloarculaceae archaeon H-GB11]
MANAWVVRPKPHGINRLDEFQEENIVAIGWPRIGNLAEATKPDIRERLQDAHDWNAHKIGQATGQIHRFSHGISEDDFVLVPSGSDVYVGRITSGYQWVEAMSGSGKGYPHQRDVEWLFDGAISRESLPGHLHDRLKCRLSVFSADAGHVKKLIDSNVVVRNRDRFKELRDQYLNRLQKGDIPGINSNSFEGSVVKLVLDNYYPSISREATTSDEAGDTDLIAELPGGVTVRVQVKHFYTKKGSLGAEAIHQLADSMTEGDQGIVVTSTNAGEDAQQATNQSEHPIGIIDGEEFVELLFEDLQNYTDDELYSLGIERPPTIREA